MSLPDKPLVATIARIKRFNARRRVREERAHLSSPFACVTALCPCPLQLRAGFSAVRMAVRVRRLASAANGSATPDLGLPGPPSTSFTRLPACMITPPTRKRTLSADAVNDVMWAPAVLAAGGAGSVPVLPPPGPPPPTAIKASSANSHKGHHHHHHPRSLGHRTSTDPKSNPASLSPGGFSLIPSTPSQRSSAWYRLRRALHAVLGSVRFRNGPQRRPSETSSEDGVAAAAAVAATGDVPPSVSPTEELLDTSSVLLTATTVN